MLVFHKVLMLTGVRALIDVLGAGAGKLKALDEAWDEEQRTLDLELQLRERKKNSAAVREAAGRVRAALLPNGAEQIGYDSEKEVEFGRTQVSLARSAELKVDVAALGLGDVITAIAATTDALAEAIGYGSSKKVTLTPGRRALLAQRRVAAACNGAYESLTELVDRAPEAHPRGAELAALKGSLDALLTRRVAAPASVKTPGEPPASPNTAPTK